MATPALTKTGRPAQRQTRREDPGTWHPIPLRPSMAPHIAVHPDHPFVALGGLVPPLVEGEDPGPSHETPILIAKTRDTPWPADTNGVSIPGGEIPVKGIQFIVVDGVKRIQAAWGKGQPIQAFIIPPDAAEPFIAAHRERLNAFSDLKESFTKLTQAARFYTSARGATCAPLVEAIRGLTAKGLPRPKVAAMLEPLGVSRKVVCSISHTMDLWSRMNLTPEQANIPEYLPNDLRLRLGTILRKRGVPGVHALVLNGIPAMIRALASAAQKMRANHAFVGATYPLKPFPPRTVNVMLEAFADTTADTATLGLEFIESLNYDALAADACRKAIFDGLHPLWIDAVERNLACYGAASLFRHFPGPTQVLALQECLATNGWTSPWGAKRFRNKLTPAQRGEV